MAVKSGSVTVGPTGATGIVAAPNPNYSQAEGGNKAPNRNVVITNGATAAVYLGGSTGVTGPSNGYTLAPSASVNLLLHLDEAIYGVVASTASTVSYIASGS